MSYETTSDTRSILYPTVLSKFGQTAPANVSQINSIKVGKVVCGSIRCLGDVAIYGDITTPLSLAGGITGIGSADQVIINDGAGVMTGEAQLATTRGGTGLASFTSGRFVTAASSSTLATSVVVPAGAVVGTTDVQAVTNKTITDTTNVVAANSLKTTGAVVNVAAAAPPVLGNVLTATSATTATWQVPAGDVTGPASSTDNAIARFDGVTGKLLQNSLLTVSDLGDISRSATKLLTVPNATSITVGMNAGATIAAGDGGNTVVGYRALNVGVGATNNTCVGTDTGLVVSTGDNNTLVGYLAGSTVTTGSGNICIGPSAGTSLTTHSNTIAVGNVAGSDTNAVYLGNASHTTFYVPAIASGTAYAGDSPSWSVLVVGADGAIRYSAPLYKSFVANTENTTALSATNGQLYYNITGGGDGDAAVTSKQSAMNVNVVYSSLRAWATFGVTGAGTLTYQLYVNGAAVGTARTVAAATNTRVTSSVAVQLNEVIAAGALLSMSITTSAAGIVITQMGWDVMFELTA